jgi:5' nucleotidase, deoxy (Pyrimidine), cytosolic type C protein (NT5C)
MKYGTIYTDYDGVCCNFIKGVEAKLGRSITGKDWEDMDQAPRNKLYSQACDNVDFWANLDPMPDYSTYWGYIKYWSPGVITAYPKWGVDAPSHAIKGKEIWNRKHTMVPSSRFFCVAREDKQKHAINNGVPNILIDDHVKNINEWEKAGGAGILHTSAVSTIIQLKSLGFKK